MTTQQRILVVGAGALGIVSAVRLASAGHDVTVAASSKSKRDYYRTHPFRLDAYDAPSHSVSLEAVFEPAEVSQAFDMIIAATKCAVALDVTRTWLPTLKPDGIFVPYFNGLLGDALSPIVGERLVECAVYYAATLIGPGHSKLTGPGGLHLGVWPHGPIGPGSRAERAAGVLKAVVPTDAYDDMLSVKWNKLVANTAMTSLGVISGLQMSGMMQQAAVRTIFREIFRESLAVAVASGARPITLGGINVGLATRLPRFVFDLALRLRTRHSGNYKSSSQQSLDRGEPTEVDYLNGRVVANGAEHGIATPWNAAIVRAVKEVEAAPESAGLAKINDVLRWARTGHTFTTTKKAGSAS